MDEPFARPPLPGRSTGAGSLVLVVIGARVVALVDAFDAMTHDRVYRSARSVADVLGEIGRLAGRQFDPGLAPVLIEEASRGPIPVPGSSSTPGP